MSTLKNICVFTSDLSVPFDEGVKQYALTLIKELMLNYRVLGLCLLGNDNKDYFIKRIRTNRFL